MISLSLPCSAVTVFPPALPTDPPLLARVVDVEPEEVLRQIEIKHVITHYGAFELLEQMTTKEIKEYLNPGV